MNWGRDWPIIPTVLVVVSVLLYLVWQWDLKGNRRKSMPGEDDAPDEWWL